MIINLSMGKTILDPNFISAFKSAVQKHENVLYIIAADSDLQGNRRKNALAFSRENTRVLLVGSGYCNNKSCYPENPDFSEIWAPAKQVISVGRDINPKIGDSKYAYQYWFNGSSFAAPQVSGAIALLMSDSKNQNKSPEQIVSCLLNYAKITKNRLYLPNTQCP